MTLWIYLTKYAPNLKILMFTIKLKLVSNFFFLPKQVNVLLCIQRVTDNTNESIVFSHITR